jgi:hypothetical protein
VTMAPSRWAERPNGASLSSDRCVRLGGEQMDRRVSTGWKFSGASKPVPTSPENALVRRSGVRDKYGLRAIDRGE